MGLSQGGSRSQLVILNKFYEREKIRISKLCEMEGWQKPIGKMRFIPQFGLWLVLAEETQIY
jgi:hypothetical protein